MASHYSAFSGYSSQPQASSGTVTTTTPTAPEMTIVPSSVKVPWYETKSTAKSVAKLLLAAVLPLAMWPRYAASPRTRRFQPLFFVASVGALFGGIYYQFLKRYYRDPIAIAEYRKHFFNQPIMDSLKQHTWENMLEVVSLDEVKAKVEAELSRLDFERIHTQYKPQLLEELMTRNIVEREYLAAKFKDLAEAPTIQPQQLVQILVNYQIFAHRSLLLSKAYLASLIRNHKAIHSLSFSHLSALGAFSLFENDILTEDIVRPRFHELIYNSKQTPEDIMDKYGADFAVLYNKDVTYANDLAYIFAPIIQRLSLADIHAKFWPRPLAKHGAHLIGDDQIYSRLVTACKEYDEYQSLYLNKLHRLKENLHSAESVAASQANTDIQAARNRRETERGVTPEKLSESDLKKRAEIEKRYSEAVAQAGVQREIDERKAKTKYNEKLSKAEEKLRLHRVKANKEWKTWLETKTSPTQGAQATTPVVVNVNINNPMPSSSTSSPAASAPAPLYPVDYSSPPPSFNH